MLEVVKTELLLCDLCGSEVGQKVPPAWLDEEGDEPVWHIFGGTTCYGDPFGKSGTVLCRECFEEIGELLGVAVGQDHIGEYHIARDADASYSICGVRLDDEDGGPVEFDCGDELPRRVKCYACLSRVAGIVAGLRKRRESESASAEDAT